MTQPHLNIMGIRGIPAAHGGFETFVARFAPAMINAGWTVTVYCQEKEGARHPASWNDEWQGIRRVHFDTRATGTLATVEFDLRCVMHVLRQPGIDLVLGYNTAIFNVMQRLAGRRVAMNMDGIEWKRQKWCKLAKAWFWLNERIGAHICSVPVADHPEIAAHLAERGCGRSVVIPYGSDVIKNAPIAALAAYGVTSGGYFISIARIEPENSILEIVTAFTRAQTGRKLVVLGRFEPDANPYHARVKAAANADVLFPGAVYESKIVQALRFHALAYLHGHQVGGTNPSLVEALGAGNPVIAHDNRFNRWTTGGEQLYFATIDECSWHMQALGASDALRADKSKKSAAQHRDNFTYARVHESYRALLCKL